MKNQKVPQIEIKGNTAQTITATLVHVHEEKLKPLKPDALEQLTKEELARLKQHYLSRREIPRLFGKPLDIEQSYINLSVIEEKKASEKGSSENKETETKNKADNLFKDERLQSFEDLFGEKRTIIIQDLFKETKEEKTKSSRRLLVQGRAGIGKTTFVTYATYGWASGTLWKESFDWIFKITLRNLTQNSAYTQENKTYNFIDIIYQECFSNLPRYRFEQLWEEKLKSSAKILLILDGLDEATTISEDKKHPLHEALQQLLWSDWPLIITSRPYGVGNLPQARRNLEIIGFTNENIEQYIQQFFRELGTNQSSSRKEHFNAQAKQLLAYLKGNPSLWGTAHIPITLNILCGIYQDEVKLADTVTMTGLYQAMERKLLEVAYCKREKDFHEMTSKERQEALQETYKDALSVLEYLAFQGVKEEALILSPHWIDEALSINASSRTKKVALFKEIKELGFIRPTVELINIKETERHQPHEFLHLSFQEYFAARYIASKIYQKELGIFNFIQEQKFNPRYQLVWWFVGGLLKTEPVAFEDYLRIIQEKNSEDLIGHYGLGLESRILEEGYGKETVVLLEPIRARIQQTILSLYHQYERGHYSPSSLVTLLRLSPQTIRRSEEQDLMALLPLLEETEEKITKMLGFIEQLGLATPRVLNLLKKYLANEARDIRESAATAIGELGAAAATPEFLAGLLSLLSDEDKGIRGRAATAIGELGAAATTPEILQGLLSLLSDEEWEVRGRAAEAIGTLGAAAATPEILQGLLSLLSDKQKEVRGRAAEAVGELGATATPAVLQGLLSLLKDKNENVRRSAANAIGRLGVAAATPEILQELLWLLNDKDKDVRRSAADAIGALGAVAATPEILQALLSLLSNKDWLVRQSAAEAIGTLGAAAATPKILQGLSSLLKDANWGVRESAANAIGKLGAVAATPEILQGLLSLLSDKKWDVHTRAAEAIGELGAAAATPEILQGLLSLLSKEWEVRWRVARAIGTLGAAAATPEILQGLLLLLSDKEWRGMHAANAIGKLGAVAATPEILQGLLSLLSDKDEGVRKRAAKVIAKLGAVAATPEILQGLLSLLSDKEWEVRKDAAYAIGKLGAVAATPEILQGLSSLLKAAEGKVRASAAEAVGGLGAVAATPEILQELLSWLEDEEGIVRASAAEAVGGLGAAAATPQFLAGLLLLLKDINNENVRKETIEIFAQWGQNHFMVLCETWRTKSIKEVTPASLFYLSCVSLIGYSSGQVQLQILPNNRKTKFPYLCCGYMGKTPFRFEVTSEQAQCLRHLIPEILGHWKETGELLSEATLLKKVQAFPSLLADLLLSNQQQLSAQKTLVSSSNNNNTKSSPTILIAYPKTNPAVKEKQQLFEADVRYQALRNDLMKNQQSLVLEKQDQGAFTITLDADEVPFETASGWLQQCSDLLKQHEYTKAYLASTPEITSDGVFHTLTILTKSQQYGDKLESFLKPLSLFTSNAMREVVPHF